MLFPLTSRILISLGKLCSYTNTNIVLIGIAVCIILLTAPALASAGYSKIYGNANEDDVLDMRDVTYIKLVIFGKKTATTFADANYDGKISMLDVGQTKLIILGKEKTLTLVDQADRAVTVPRPIDQLVAFSVDSIRTTVALGAADKLVGIVSYLPKYKDRLEWLSACPELIELPTIGSFSDPNCELILSLKPDVVFVGTSSVNLGDTIEEKTGIPAVGVSTFIISHGPAYNESNEAFRLVGRVIGMEEEAEEIVQFCNEEIDKVTKVTLDIPESEKPKVYLAFWSTWNSDSKTPLRYDPVDKAGGINVAAELKEGFLGEVRWNVIVSIEQIIEWNPDIILIHSSSKEHKFSIEDVLSDPRLQTVNAVKNNRVHYTKGFFIGWDPATGLIENYYMAKLFHPDKFEDLDVEEEGNEILKRFYGVDDLYTEMAERCDLYRWD